MITDFSDEKKYVSELYVCTKCNHETLIYFEADNAVDGIFEVGLTCKFCNEQVDLIAGDLIVRMDIEDTGNDDGSQLQCAYLPEEYVEICSECAIFRPIEWTKLRCLCPFCDVGLERIDEKGNCRCSMVSKKLLLKIGTKII